MKMYLVLSNGKLVWSTDTLKKARGMARHLSTETNYSYEVVKSMGVFEKGTGELLK